MSMDTRPIVVSFSGGRTSALMSVLLKRHFGDKVKLIFLFANTGQEHEKTLRFVDDCDKAFGLDVVWLEAEVCPEKGKGTTHRLVNFDSASRAGRPFEDMCAKYGVSNQAYPHCTRELKLQPIKSYLRSLGYKKGDYRMAVGIRADEIDRMSASADDNDIIYPLISMWPTTKNMVIDWWSGSSYDLDIPEHLGNCVWCWKKSDRKLYTLAREHPEIFDFPNRMENKYGFAGRDGRASGHDSAVFFRGGRSAKDIIREANENPHIVFDPEMPPEQMDFIGMDRPGSGCSEECGIGDLL